MAFETYLETALRRETAPYVEAWLGHKVKYQGAYFRPNPLLSLKVYKSIYYEALAIRRPSRDMQDLEKRVRQQEEEIRAILESKAVMENRFEALKGEKRGHL